MLLIGAQCFSPQGDCNPPQVRGVFIPQFQTGAPRTHPNAGSWTYRKPVRGPIGNWFVDLSEIGSWTNRKPVRGKKCATYCSFYVLVDSRRSQFNIGSIDNFFSHPICDRFLYAKIVEWLKINVIVITWVKEPSISFKTCSWHDRANRNCIIESLLYFKSIARKIA